MPLGHSPDSALLHSIHPSESESAYLPDVSIDSSLAVEGTLALMQSLNARWAANPVELPWYEISCALGTEFRLLSDERAFLRWSLSPEEHPRRDIFSQGEQSQRFERYDLHPLYVGELNVEIQEAGIRLGRYLEPLGFLNSLREEEESPRRPVALIPSFQILVPLKAFAKFFGADWKLSFAMTHGVFRVDDRFEIWWPHIAEKDGERFEIVTDYLTQIAGKDPEALEGLLAMFGGKLPVVLGPHRDFYDGSTWRRHSVYETWRFPFGALASNREVLLNAQAMVEEGRFSNFTVELRGHIAPALLRWMQGGAVLKSGEPLPDPIPDVEVVYALPLPSGDFYRILLKSARGGNGVPADSVEQYSTADRKVISGLQRYLRSSDWRERLDLFDYPGWQSNFERGKRPEISDYIRRKEYSLNAIYDRLATESMRPQSELHKRWTEYRFSSLTEFEGVAFDLLDRIGEIQSVLPAPWCKFKADERSEFAATYFPELWGICSAEKERLDRERTNGTIERRKSMGYGGPDEGYAIPLAKMLIDCIVDFRRGIEYRSEQSRLTGIAPELVETPPHVGRSYSMTPDAFGLSELPVMLEKFSGHRTVQATIRDPMATKGIRVVGEKELQTLDFDMSQLNIKRMLEKLPAGALPTWTSISEMPKKMSQADMHWANILVWKQWADRVTELSEGSLKGERSEAGLANARKEARQNAESAVKGLQPHYPEIHAACVMRLVSIIDQSVLRLSYVIRADNSVVFGLDFPHLKGTSRLLHSQLSGGRNFYPAGRIEILRRQEQFASVDSWRKSDRLLRNKGFPAWRASKLDNGTGHGECGPEAAVWAAKIILPALATIGISTNECRVTDVFTPNMPII